MDIFLYDTNILLSDPYFRLIHLYEEIGNCQVVIIKSILDELDKLKSKEDYSSYLSREASRSLENLLNNSTKDNLGWEILPGCHLIIDEKTELDLPKDLHTKTYDDRLLAAVIKYTEDYDQDTVWLMSLDRNLRVRANAKDLNCIPSFIHVDTNHVFIPFAELVFRWTASGENSVRLPLKLNNGEDIWVDIWPYWGYPSGDISTLHFRFHKSDEEGTDQTTKDSPILIFSTENRIRYKNKLGMTPYQIIAPEYGKSYQLIENKWKLDINIIRLEINQPQIDKNQARSNALMNIGLGLSTRGFISGVLIGDGIRTMTAAAKNTPYFSQLGFSINASLASNQEIDQSQKELKNQIKATKSKKTHNLVAILIVGGIIFGLPLLLTILCWLFPLLLGLLSGS